MQYCQSDYVPFDHNIKGRIINFMYIKDETLVSLKDFCNGCMHVTGHEEYAHKKSKKLITSGEIKTYPVKTELIKSEEEYITHLDAAKLSIFLAAPKNRRANDLNHIALQDIYYNNPYRTVTFSKIKRIATPKPGEAPVIMVPRPDPFKALMEHAAVPKPTSLSFVVHDELLVVGRTDMMPVEAVTVMASAERQLALIERQRALARRQLEDEERKLALARRQLEDEERKQALERRKLEDIHRELENVKSLYEFVQMVHPNNKDLHATVKQRILDVVQSKMDSLGTQNMLD